ncbi:Protein CBR-ENG-1 [Caenorhabditis briggsae]|uniref:Cytosolic endo-beta-N-acetylglucosaminidase TIM barrel domain-containing protein n=2 Tax=Caenorhabditis briggsae TaxID=6238 RepID=A0AAE9DA01_CAEBR|nr:Protein CBR-ENG-1 [Caenorhabditis briggsae]ULT99494.1 hypothetical protein L3Y34_000661 [Caenorhabditis briggsae]UMM22169.1 hypothetical protein L5515_003520 [Caenorhabditis briggsae]CAP28720.2 Protein CBR-ENG-1 [Caenorhabditis briggsae]
MTISPIDTLEELWSWEKREDVGNDFTEPLVHFKPHSGPQILVCHDMRGGYLPEESTEGKQFEKDKYPYMFLNWWQIDVFNYFSHHFVTIPPSDYTRIAHKHGVLSLGTFITEWKSGKEICSRILENEETMEKTVNSLVAVANYYGFDGWLINIENEIDEEKIELLICFCEKLTQKSKEKNLNSKVIWYDSVLHNGKLHWQNALNSKNNKFYEACDAIYLNYNWKDGDLLRSAEFGILEKIFVGIDVWARGCVGEFNCDQSFALAKLFHMSVALFAPGWIYEKFEEENQILKGILFWSKIYPHVKTRPLTSASFTTNFATGMDENWHYQLGKIQLQPQSLTSFCHQVVGKGLKLFGRHRKFLLFTFDSNPFKKIKVTCICSHPIDLVFNKTDFAVKSEDSTWIYEQSGFLESISIQTANHDETVIESFCIITEEINK